MRRAGRAWPALLVVAGCLSYSGGTEARSLSFDDRVAAQRAIEEVYWNHRIWPAENPTPKPPLSAVMSDDALRARAEDALRKSNALEAWWQRPVTPEQLQAELDRMAAQSRGPDMLRELFTALGNDPFVIAETLARQTLVERLIRSWYANDERFHGELKREIGAALRSCATASCMPSMGGEFGETTWVLRRAEDDSAQPRPGDGTVALDPGDWQEHLDRLARSLGGTAEALPLQRVGDLEETNDGLVVAAVLAQAGDRVKTATVSWRKVPFDAWWKREREAHTTRVAEHSRVFALPRLRASRCESDTWSPTAVNDLSARWRHTAVWTGTEMIVWGGDASGSSNTGYRYSPATETWLPTSVGPSTPTARIGHTAVWTGTEMIVWGGTVSGGTTHSGGRYDPSTDTWMPTSTPADVPTPRSEHTAIWTGTEMIVWGGDVFSKSGGRYDPVSDTWSSTSTASGAPSGRHDHTSVWTGTEMIVWGGFGIVGSGSAALSTGGRYNPTSNTWLPTSVGSGLPSRRYDHTAVWTGAEMIVWGGRQSINQVTNTGGRYDPVADTWVTTSVTPVTPIARSDHTAVWTGDAMIVWGGKGGSSYAGGRYDPSSNSWQRTSLGSGVPEGRYGHTAVWTGAEMIVWGGTEVATPGGSLADGGRYAPSSDTWVPVTNSPWVPVTNSGVNEQRYNHTAIWTGAEMIVWGGRDGSSLRIDTGGRYDPALDTWAETSTTGAPAPRDLHAMVWTGTEMIVWGGYGGAAFNTGGRYDPSNDTWAATSTGAGVPSARSSHTAVWTGTEMVVWGGGVGASVVNTGARYDPSNDTWVATSIGAEVPSARANQTVVWTGTEMIVWGGWNGVGFVGTGSRYDAAGDAWASMSIGAGAPSARAFHTAVWTGSEMVVWGGWATYVDGPGTGGLYDPLSDSWLPTSTGLNAPSNRRRHSVVWTGEEMIVWGGWDPRVGELGTGGLYDPRTDSWLATSTGSDVPTPRFWHTAVWTGDEMIVSGGFPDVENSSRYCVCPIEQRRFPDEDGDGHGQSSLQSSTCADAPGYVTNHGDCDDSNPAVHPGMPETCNGLDDDCDGTTDVNATGPDQDSDGVADCEDGCPHDPAKLTPGDCGCGVAETDGDADGTPDCHDGCSSDPEKVAPGVCGCGIADSDFDGDGTPDCVDGCPTDPTSVAPGPCGCFESDADADGAPDCVDGCPTDPTKVAPGPCGCFETDADADDTPDCIDVCPTDAGDGLDAEFQVNSYATSQQGFPAVAALPGGMFVVVWTSVGQDGSLAGVYGRLFDAQGNAPEREFRINDFTPSIQTSPAVAANDGFGFVVAWTSLDQDGFGLGVFARRYDTAGQPLGDEFQVNVEAVDAQRVAGVALADTGHFFVVWESVGQDGSGTGIYARRFDETGLPLGGEFRGNVRTGGDQSAPAVAHVGAGEFVVVWHGPRFGGADSAAFGRRFDAAGQASGDEFFLGTSALDECCVDIARNPLGGWIAVWERQLGAGLGRAVFGRRFDDLGAPIAAEFPVNTIGDHSLPAVAMDGAGRFVALWDSSSQDGSGSGVYGRRFDGAGNAVTGEVRFNTYTPSHQSFPAVAANAAGRFLGAWHSNGQDGSSYGVFARFGELDTDLDDDGRFDCGGPCLDTPQGQCCRPTDGALLPIDDGDVCTLDVCLLDGTVAHARDLPGPVGPTLRLARMEAGTALSWSPDSGTQWNVYRGSLVPGDPWTYDETCFVAGLALPATLDADAPSAGAAFYYLVGTVGTCGESAIGETSGGEEHFATPGCVP